MSTTPEPVVVEFNEENPNWSTWPHHNTYFVQSIQASAHDLLRERGYITLNYLYRLLGLSENRRGALAGWKYETGMFINLDMGGTPEDRHQKPFTITLDPNSHCVFDN